MTIVEKMQKEYLEKYKKILEQREEIITAYIAKYGIEPEKICQVEWRKSSTETIWFIKHNNEIVCSYCNKIIKEEENKNEVL